MTLYREGHILLLFHKSLKPSIYKTSWKRHKGPHLNDITKEEFLKWTNGAWTFPYSSKKEAGGHPVPFPVELPRRCIKLFSFVGDTVLDPFLEVDQHSLPLKRLAAKLLGLI